MKGEVTTRSGANAGSAVAPIKRNGDSHGAAERTANLVVAGVGQSVDPVAAVAGTFRPKLPAEVWTFLRRSPTSVAPQRDPRSPSALLLSFPYKTVAATGS